MPYGYLGQNQPNQTVSNSGVFSITDVASLEKQGKFGGSLELITEQSTSGVSYWDFTSIQQAQYDVHLLHLENITFSGGESSLGIQFYESGVLESASVYQYAQQYGDTTNYFAEVKSTARNLIYINPANFGNGSYDSGNAYVYLYNLGNSSKYSFLTLQQILEDNGVVKMSFGGGVLPQASEVDGFRLVDTIGGRTFSATAKLYGVKQL